MTSDDGVGSLGHDVALQVPGLLGVDVAVRGLDVSAEDEDAARLDEPAFLSPESRTEQPATASIENTATPTNTRVKRVRPAPFMAKNLSSAAAHRQR
uniref:hypothetical protein n=1 Tax=Gordonia sp. B7-2 TaxID=3420932 RepID=UPI003D9490DF